MTITEIINSVLAGGMLGALGQGIRVAVGLKKFNEENASKAASGKPTEEFSTSRLVISIFIGAVAGALGMLVKGEGLAKDGNFSTESIVTIIAIGYSGADFIEGVFNTYIGKFSKTDQQINKPAPFTSGNGLSNEQPVLVPDEANFSNTPAQG